MTNPAIGSILVGVDFSDASGAALAVAAQLGKGMRAQLHAIHVAHFDPPPYFTPAQIEMIVREHDASLSAARQQLADYVERHSAQPASVDVIDGPPDEVLVSVAKDHGLLVVGTHGRRGPRHWWLGSVAERVVRSATVPVLVIQGNEATSTPARVFERVLVAAAHGEPVTRARALADRLAAAFGGAVDDTGALDTCSPDRVGAASLLVLAVPSPDTDRTIGSLETSVLRTCHRPVLFVPHSA